MKFCGNCGHKIEGEEKYCPACGAKIALGEEAEKSKEQSNTVEHMPKIDEDSILGHVNKYVGNKEPADLNWRVLFSDVFQPHTKEEAENIFICGTAQSTPNIKEVMQEWPHPWLYSRVFLMFAIAFGLLWICCSSFSNMNTLPGLIVVGSFAVPLATMVLFIEMNAYKDISFYEVIKIFLVGGCASLLATLFLGSIVGPHDLDYTGAIIVGITEEIAKALIVCYFIINMKTRTILGGLLIGASVGAGFAAFESAGYAMRPLINFMQYAGYAAAYGQEVDSAIMLDKIIDSIFSRGFLAPGGHVAWAAISGAALSMVARLKGSAGWSLLTERRFLHLFIIPVILHALWDCPFITSISQTLFAGYIALSVGVWIVLLMLIDMGLKEVSQLKEEKIKEEKDL